MHSTDNLDDDYLGSGCRLAKAKIKYGKENFKKEILEFLPNRSTLEEREKQLVNEDLLKNSMCMNIVVGGKGGWTDEQRRRGALTTNKIIRNRLKNDLIFRKKWIENSSNNMKKLWKEGKVKVPNWNGRHHTEESKKKQSESMKNKIPWNKGLKSCYSKVTNENRSNSLKGNIPWNKNKVLSEEHKNKIRNSILNRMYANIA